MTTAQKIYSLLEKEGKIHTLNHSKEVERFALSTLKDKSLSQKVSIACALHDIAVILPKDSWIDKCVNSGVNVLPEEIKLPMLVHQKVSSIIAKEHFGIRDKEILSAVSCHTTLKPDASYLDLLLFVSDKIKWDGQGEPPWLKDVNCGLETSLHTAALNYMSYVIENGLIKLIHPEFEKAFIWLKSLHLT